MTWLVWPGAALLLVALLLAVRLKVRVWYDRDGFRLRAYFGALPVFRLPGPPKSPEEEAPESLPKRAGVLLRRLKARRAAEEEAGEAPAAGGLVSGFRAGLPIILRALGKLRRKLRIDELTLWYQSACDDPMLAALAFGAASAAAGTLLAPLERFFRIRRRDVRTAVSFTETEALVYLRLRLHISVAAALCIALPLLRGLKRTKTNE